MAFLLIKPAYKYSMHVDLTGTVRLIGDHTLHDKSSPCQTTHSVDISHSTSLAMEGESALKLFLLQTIAVFFAEVNADSTFSRSSYFTTRENKQLKGYVVKRFDSPSLLSCGQQCIRNAWCTSTNYKMSTKKDGKGTCELNKHDISLLDENAEFVDQPGGTFSILLKVNRIS